mmetsp:Transcript_5915/g.14023  ORF Transcript_5915/g.14023 Transcript_5915/m.14023 type:complete len:479 (+) Transcript_5915:93-1529(+)
MSQIAPPDDGLSSTHSNGTNRRKSSKTIREEKGLIRSALEQEHFEDEEGSHHSVDHPHGHIGSARTPWYGTTVVLLSEVMGTGVLSLPFAARTLGWISTLISIPLFAIIAAYSGWLLALVKREHHDFGSYADASTELLGHAFGAFTKACMLVNWGALAVYYMIALSNGLGDLFQGMCDYERTIIAACLLILPCQCRDFYNISKYLSIPSTLAIVVLLVTVMVNLSEDDLEPFAQSTSLEPLPNTSPFDFLASLSAFVFAYQGQSIYFELMSEMKDFSQFPMACSSAYFGMCIVYAATVVVAYGVKGANTPEFLPDSMQDGLAKRIAGALVILHIAVSYVICCQPLHDWLHSKIFPQTYHEESRLGTMHWFLITTGYLVFGFVVGNLIPFFADVQALIGSLFGAPTIFGWPSIFFVMMYRQKASSWLEAISLMGYGHAFVCGMFLFICTPLFCILGTTGAVQAIIEDSKQAMSPFQCNK